MILASIVLFAVFLGGSDCTHNRFKRVINGVPLNGRPSTYTAIRYYGAMMTTNNLIWNFIVEWDFVKPTDMYCSGSLLTPGIFQTACHCLADFDINDARYLKPSFIQNHWEGRAVVYPGVSNLYGPGSIQKSGYVLTLKFMVHSKCAKFGQWIHLRYDYGLVKLDAQWVKSDRPGWFPWKEIEWAPHYTAKAIKDFHSYALQRQLVCLIVGFGWYTRYPPEKSDVLRTGWGSLLSFHECYDQTAYVFRGQNLSVLQNWNWVCTKDFPHHAQEQGIGDSGGPLSCQNIYYGVISSIGFDIGKHGIRVNIISITHDLVHTLYTNAIDFRKFFIRAIDDQPIYIRPRGIDDCIETDCNILRYSHSSLRHVQKICVDEIPTIKK